MKKNERGTQQVLDDPVGAQRKRNDHAIRLLESWRKVDSEGASEQRETWKYLKKALDADRLSDRKLFP